MIKVYTTIAKEKHKYSDEMRRGILFAVIDDIAYITLERCVQSWQLKVSDSHLSLMVQCFYNGKPDLKTEDIIVKQFLKNGIDAELITIDYVTEKKEKGPTPPYPLPLREGE